MGEDAPERKRVSKSMTGVCIVTRPLRREESLEWIGPDNESRPRYREEAPHLVPSKVIASISNLCSIEKRHRSLNRGVMIVGEIPVARVSPVLRRTHAGSCVLYQKAVPVSKRIANREMSPASRG